MPRRTNSDFTPHNSKLRKLVPLLLAWYAQNARDLPWRRTRDPYAIWVSEIMLQQTQVKTVLPYWERWMRELPTLEALARAGSGKIHKLWEGLGYYTRVRNLQKAARWIVRNHRGRFPETFDEVLALPGIGRYTAGAICSIAFDQPTPVLDGNVIRVLTRIFGIAENPHEKGTNTLLWRFAAALVRNSKLKTQNSQRPCSHLNQSLMELGALICTPRNPDCLQCPATKLCAAFRENRVSQLPNLTPRKTAARRHFAAFVLRRHGRFLARQRSSRVVNAHLWEFPNAEWTGHEPDVSRTAQSALGFTPRSLEKLCSIQHSITRYRITLDAFLVKDGNRGSGVRGTGRWLTLNELAARPFPSAHKKILARLLLLHRDG
jgi:A/G-specific adenine glycosylase